MATRQGRKLNSDADHSVSLHSLSFVSLVSIPDLKPKSTPPKQESKTDPEFEFASTEPNLNSAASPMKIRPADLLISNGQLQPQAFAFQSNQFLITNPPSFRGSLQATCGHSKRSSAQTDSTRRYDEFHHASKQPKQESTGTRTRFGAKFFKLLISPCRECHAIKPGTIEAQTVSRIKC